jgi:hypothetical protein
MAAGAHRRQAAPAMKHNDGVADGDFTWPPRDADLEACGVILVGDEGAPDAEIRVVVHLSEVLPPPDSPAARRQLSVPAAHAMPTAHGPRFRHWGVEHPEAAYPFHVESDRPLPDGSSAGEAWRAALALAAGLSLAVLSYAQFRGARGELPVPELTAALAPVVAEDTQDIDVAAAARAVLDDVAGTPAPVDTQPAHERGAPTAAPPAVALRASRVPDDPPPLDAPAAPVSPALVAARNIAAPIDAPTPPVAVAVAVDERTEVSEPIAEEAAFVDPAPRDEDHIHAE